MKMARQGDVLVAAASKPKKLAPVAKEQGRVILAHGEVTGHAHEIVPANAAMLMDAPNGDRFLLVDAPCALIHQEHGTIQLAPGSYKVTRQREYSPEEIRQVAD
jgi:hypothetical protein